MGIETAIGLGIAGMGAGAVSSAVGAGKTADALAKAGQAQADAAKEQVGLAREALRSQIDTRASSITQAQQVAALSPSEISAIGQMLDTRDTALKASFSSIQKQQGELDAMDPSVKAAGQNLYDLLSGKAAQILAPLQTQLDKQRQNLVSQLSSQMGPGFMTSSAGIQALTQFDNQAAMTLGTAQLNAVQIAGTEFGNLSGLQMKGQSDVTGQTQNAFTQSQTTNSGVLQAYQFAQNRETNATLGAMSANPINPFGVPNAQGSVVAAAGAPFSGQAFQGGQMMNTGSAFGNFGAQLVTGGINKGLGVAPAGAPSSGAPGVPLANQTQNGPWAGGYGPGTMNGGYTGNFGAMIASN